MNLSNEERHHSIQKRDQQIYQYILQKQRAQLRMIQPLNVSTALLTHILFKVIVIMLFYFEEIFNQLITALVTSELSIVFVVIDFWFTKNVNGRKMIGIKWFFGQDQFGTERFKYQVRINQEYLNPVNSKLFWIMQIVYITVPIIDMITTIIMVPNIYMIKFDKILINFIVIAGGVSNFFLFYKAVAASKQKVHQLKTKFGHEFIRKLGPNSIISYL